MAARRTFATIPASSKPILAPSAADAVALTSAKPRHPGRWNCAMLHLSNLHVKYGPIPALRGLDMQVNAGEIVALIGANGAGKSTTLKAISGLVPLFGGAIAFNGRSLAGLSPEQRVELGIIHVPEGR